MDPDNISPRSEPSPQRNPWNPENYASSTTPTIVRPPNPRQQRYHSVSRRRNERQDSSSGAWSHKAEPPSAPSERVNLDDDGHAGRGEKDDDASTGTQRVYGHASGERFTPSRMGHHRNQRTPKPPAAIHGSEQQQRHYQEEDGFENVELGGGFGDAFMMVESNSPDGNGYDGRGKGKGRKYYSSFSWWHDEYIYAGLSVVAVIGLAVFLRTYDGQVLPQEFGWAGLSFETGVVALVTAMRLCMDAYVGSAISQGAWLWVSERAQMRRRSPDGKCGAKLEDFGRFDAASRGLRGALGLIWRLKGRHLGCVGAAIAVLGIGFETFSQEMVSFEQQPRRLENSSLSPAPAPARSEV